MNRILAACLLALGLAQHAAAATAGGVTLPDSYVVDGQTLRLNGIGVRALSIIGVRIYVAALYTVAPSGDARAILASSTPKALVLAYLHDGSKSQVEEEYRKGSRQNCGNGECPAADAPDFERLVAAAPAVKAGETTTYIVTARGLRVLANNRPVIELANPDLAMRILEGFIGPRPPTEDLRAGLLGKPQ